MTTGPTASYVTANADFINTGFGVYSRRATIFVTGMTGATGATGDNAIPHGLPYTPQRVTYRPSSNAGSVPGLWGEIQTPDGAAVYIHVGLGGSISGYIDVEE